MVFVLDLGVQRKAAPRKGNVLDRYGRGHTRTRRRASAHPGSPQPCMRPRAGPSPDLWLCTHRGGRGGQGNSSQGTPPPERLSSAHAGPQIFPDLQLVSHFSADSLTLPLGPKISIKKKTKRLKTNELCIPLQKLEKQNKQTTKETQSKQKEGVVVRDLSSGFLLGSTL